MGNDELRISIAAIKAVVDSTRLDALSCWLDCWVGHGTVRRVRGRNDC